MERYDVIETVNNSATVLGISEAGQRKLATKHLLREDYQGKRRQLGQFLTPSPVADFMASTVRRALARGRTAGRWGRCRRPNGSPCAAALRRTSQAEKNLNHSL